MARALARSAPSVIVMPARRRSSARRIVRVAGRAVRRHGKRALPTVAVAIGGIVVGYLDGRGTFDDIPTFGGMTHMTTIGLAGYLATRFTSDSRVRAAGLAALAAAAFDWGREQGREAEGGGGTRRGT